MIEVKTSKVLVLVWEVGKNIDCLDLLNYISILKFWVNP